MFLIPMDNNWLPEWFKISYKEAEEFLFSPVKYSIVKPFQLLIQILFLLLAGVFMLIILVIKNGSNFITKDNRWLFVNVKIVQRLRKFIK